MKLLLETGLKMIMTTLLFGVASTVLADSGTISSIASTVTTEATSIAKLLSVTSYVAGVGFALAGILKFKAHKDAPQQVALSVPVVYIVVAACLLFLPSILTIAGASLFGSSATSAATAGGGNPLGGQ